MKNIGFQFPVDESGQWDGFNDPGIEHFTGNRLQHLGREVPQNTIDAKTAKPARITIALVKVVASTLPGHDELADAVARCTEAANKEGDKAKKFFAEATKLLGAGELNVLQIRDSNTTGLTGPCRNGTPYFAMLKATGQSQKPGTSTGSYGIGKFAPFAVSELRTVFVSTVWSGAKGKLQHYVQGKSVLMSHLDAKGQTRRGTGFWGERKGCLPITELNELVPDWLSLADPDGSLEGQCGTMLSIVGYSPTKNWQHVLAANIVENFFGAIWGGELEVEIKDGPTITAATLDGVLEDNLVGSSIADQPERELFTNVASYLTALKGGEEVQVAQTENQHLGTCELRILVGENLPKRVAVLRNGMLITESLPGLKRFSDFKEFVAVLECKAEKGQRLLRAMEPPRHDAFEPDRLAPDLRHAGRTALRELSDWVRKMLVRFAKDPVQEETNLDELADYFGDEEEQGEGTRNEENPNGRIIFRARAVKAKPHRGNAAIGASEKSVEEFSEGAEVNDVLDADQHGGNPGNADKGDTRSEDPGNHPAKPSRDGAVGAAPAPPQRTMFTGLALADVRAVVVSPCKRRVAFTPSTTGELVVELQDSGTDTNYALTVVGSDTGVVSQGRIGQISAQGGSRIVMEVELAEPFNGTLRVVANAV